MPTTYIKIIFWMSLKVTTFHNTKTNKVKIFIFCTFYKETEMKVIIYK